MSNNWKEIWDRRNMDEGIPDPDADEFSVYTWLKKLDSYNMDIGNEDACYKSFYYLNHQFPWKFGLGEYKTTLLEQTGMGSTDKGKKSSILIFLWNIWSIW